MLTPTKVRVKTPVRRGRVVRTWRVVGPAVVEANSVGVVAASGCLSQGDSEPLQTPEFNTPLFTKLDSNAAVPTELHIRATRLTGVYPRIRAGVNSSGELNALPRRSLFS